MLQKQIFEKLLSIDEVDVFTDAKTSVNTPTSIPASLFSLLHEVDILLSAMVNVPSLYRSVKETLAI